jgi:nucleoid-associated protein YgaU
MSAYRDIRIARFRNGDLSADRIPFTYQPSNKDVLHTIIEGDRLDTLAFKHYQSSNLWYVIADVNGIINPFELTVGDSILIPGI